MTDSIIPFQRRGGVPPDAVFALKGEARQLRADALAQGRQLSHAAALEELALSKGFRTWNALNAHASQAGAASQRPQVFPWQQLDQPLPELPLQFVKPHELRRSESITELMRWARQMEFISTKVAPDDRPESMELIGNRVPYVLEQSRSRWPDGLFHLCDRGYDAFKGIALTGEQIHSLGLPEWNDEFGQHGGNDSFTLLGDDWRYTRKEDMLKRMARLLASIALVVNSTPATA